MYFLVLIGVLLLLVLLGSRSNRVGKFVSYHVINLDRSPDRLAAFNARAAAAGLPPVSRWRAADTKKITRDETIAQNISGWLYDRAEKRKAFGMIGATISHRELLRYLATLPAADTDLHVVFEDDAAIPRDFIAKWATVAPYVPADYDIIYFGWLFPNMHKVAGPICAANPTWLNNGHVGNTGVNAYAVRHGALPKILDHVAFSHTAFDNMISEKATEWGVYYCNPQIVPQDSELGSTIVGA